ncbi:CBO0543 family protein [Paenibacillus sp. GD4]|uniref:CBO0543 family protein n=1 Tax=Paenibacillus sp. GD4 TaxID=3068890 RepID=UPI00279664ED|nr:CBO0543 family protein [Paenibacillus sp. GD4]MDQ1913268.1 CBO0543 family protein [Paenibacillus sp. GD4]
MIRKDLLMKYPLYEYVLIIIPTLIGILGGYWIVRNNWHRYGLLFFISGAVGTGLCYLFIVLRFYSFPDRPLHGHLIVPAFVMFTFIPFTVVAGVRYSPKIWSWKIPFYWVLVHLAIVSEMLLIQYTNIFTFTFGWDLWDSYTLW